MFRFENLEIWRESLEYANHVYSVCESFPKEEIFGLTSQLKRAVLSVSSNIAEGCGSNTLKDFSNYLDISIKSLYETVSQLYFAKERGYINDRELGVLYAEAEILVKKIQSFKKSIRKPYAISHKL